MADGTNRRAHTSARIVSKDPEFADSKPRIVSRHNDITKAEMKGIEAKRVRDLRDQGHKLPHNRERDSRYRNKPTNNKKGSCWLRI